MRALLVLIAIGMMASSQVKADHPAYVVYDKQGDTVELQALVNKAKAADVVLFGEQHNNPIAHWLQQTLARKLYSTHGDSLMLGGEMFQTEDQMVINEYVRGQIKEKHFTNSADLWDNYDTDYRPLVEMAKRHGMQFVATNIPRRYANFVAYNGLEALDTFSQSASANMAPRPIPMNMDLPGYQRIQQMGAHGQAEHLAKAQAVKDATMAHTINEYWEPGYAFLHLNGSFHSNNFEGIYWYLEQYNEDIETMTIATVQQQDPTALKADHEGKADFIICTPKDMTKTY